jgi:quercetin dioxygenase-like cupin family protein
MERINTYQRWLGKEGLPVIGGYSVPDVMAVELKPWPRKGGSGAYINLIGAEGMIDAYLCEIPPGKSLLPQKHLYEELIYVLSGYGTTSVWIEGNRKQSFEWHEGSLFSPPLNTWHQHFNGQGTKPARYIGFTRAIISLNLFHDINFVFNNNYVFKDRYSGEDNYFSSQGRQIEGTENVNNPKIWQSNFVADCRTFELVDDPKRGGLQYNARMSFSNGQMTAHISEIPGGAYMKAHFHGPGAHLLCLKGQGYELMWPAESGASAEGVERMKIDWQPGTLFSPPERVFHQHFSIGKEPSRLLAFHTERSPRYVGIEKEWPRTKDYKKGGNQIEYEDEDPAIRKLFKQELAKTGVPWRMSKFFPGE